MSNDGENIYLHFAPMKEIHIGTLIKAEVDRKGKDVMNYSDFAKLINRTRSAVTRIFKESSINTDLLLKISEVLEYDFFEIYLQRPKPNNTIKVQVELEFTREELRQYGL